jgi:hypothetical protein
VEELRLSPSLSLSLLPLLLLLLLLRRARDFGAPPADRHLSQQGSKQRKERRNPRWMMMLVLMLGDVELSCGLNKS